MQVFPNVTITDPGDPTEIAPRTVLPAQLKPMLELDPSKVDMVIFLKKNA
jgi:hypothetical protein